MRLVIAVALGGAMGAAGRYGVGELALPLLGAAFPWGTLAANVVGSLAMGALAELAALRITLTPSVRAFLMVGVLGGFTTFSAYALDVVDLMERAAYASAIAYGVASVVLSVGGLFVGLWLVRRACA